MIKVTSNNPESWLEAIWEALHTFRHDCAPEGNPEHDRQWEEICTAMAWIREALDLPEEVNT